MIKTKNFISDINKFMKSELDLIHSLDITEEPYVQTQKLIDQALLLLYGDYYLAYVQKQQQQDYNKYFTTLWHKEIDCYKVLYPATQGEFIDLITQLYLMIIVAYGIYSSCIALILLADLVQYLATKIPTVVINIYMWLIRMPVGGLITGEYLMGLGGGLTTTGVKGGLSSHYMSDFMVIASKKTQICHWYTYFPHTQSIIRLFDNRV